ncbi:response regulator [Salinarimonas rosea]|uniref:response regulator n=1 Tax=Salinarimonas rosea TaxID=552063 RepID=UPI000409766D|nr:response regulator [Salinarimonas rosea]
MIEPLSERAAERSTTVLLVEDEPLVRLDLEDTLRDAGYAVVACATAEEGRDVLRSGLPVDAIVTDVRTPGAIDGLELAREARSRAATLPIVVVSGHLSSAIAEAASADAFFRKPVSSGTIRAALERLLELDGSGT